jgi:polyisoprenoid-binding protein YceI
MQSVTRLARGAALGLVLAFVPGLALAADFDVDTAHTRVGFAVRHMMVSNVRGTFAKFAGSVALDDQDVTRSAVHLDIDVASIDTDNAKRDEHLRSADFFDAAKYPTITFKSTKVARAGDGLDVAGNLTIKNVTRPVVLKVGPLASETKDPWAGTRRGATATAKISRKAFGLTWNKALEGGGVVVGDEITIELEVELVKKVAEAKK